MALFSSSPHRAPLRPPAPKLPRRLLAGLLPWFAAVAAMNAPPATVSAAPATSVVSAGNIPFSGISPGGVDMATGELILVCRPDLAINGPLPLVFRRYYASMLAREGLAMGPMGPNWLSSFDWSLSMSASSATLVTDRGAAIQFTLSPSGAWVLASPTYAPFRLEPSGAMWRFTDPLDRRIYLFDGTTHLLAQILDEHGNGLSFTYAGGLLSQVTDGLGRAFSFVYDASSHLTQVSDGTRSVHYSYTGGVLTGFTDASGHAWTYGYDDPPEPSAPALLTGVIEPLGNAPVTQAYDSSGRVMSQMDALGGAAMYAYGTPSGNTFTDPMGNPWTYQHDGQNRLMGLLDPMDGSTLFGYDAAGRLSSYTRPLGDGTSFLYDASSGYPSQVTFADGSMVSWGYSSHLVGGATLFDLSTASYPDGTGESYGRDTSGNLTDFMDRGGKHWTATYNSRGQVLTATNPAGGVTTFTYDGEGRPATGQDNTGNTAQYGYDALSRLTQVTWPDATLRQYGYDDLDDLTGLTDERGKLWAYGYDGDGRLTTETDPLMDETGFDYDAGDRVTQIVDPLSHAVQYGYDPDGRLMSLTDRSGRTTGFQYDGLNRLIGVIDPAGGADQYGYDGDSRLTSAQDPMGDGSTYGYDALDRLTHVTDPVGTGYDCSYDSMGRLHTATAPLGQMETFNYDARGLLASFFNSSSETDFARTSLGEISQVTDPNRNAWPRGYDPQGRIASSDDPLSRGTAYGYDALSRLTQITRPDGSTEQLMYDAAGRLTEAGTSDGTSLTYGYDDANRLVSASGASFQYDAAGRMTGSNGFAFTYDPDGRILSETLAPGKVVTYGYDSRGLLSQVMDWMGGTTGFQYDAARRLIGIIRPNGTTAAYQYDAASRLTSEVESDPGPVQISSIGIIRDALGQPTSITRRMPLMPGETSASTSGFAFDAASQIVGIGHDALGRTTGDGSRTFQWDEFSRLTRYAAGADSPSFAYDAFGQVKGSSLGDQVVQQAWTYAHSVPTVDDMQVNLPSRTHLYVRAPSGLLLYSVDGSTGARTFYHYDEAGNTAYLTNDGGSVTAEYAYSPFGGVSGVGQTADNPFTYGAAAGMTSLGSSGLWTAGGAVYDDRTMRVISALTTASGPVGRQPGPTQRPPSPNVPGAWGLVSPAAHQRPPSPNRGFGGGPVSTPGDWVSLNPQPLPPGGGGGFGSGPIVSPGEWVSLNPQPLPPGGGGGFGSGPIVSPGEWVSLNPQPLPPGSGGGFAGGSIVSPGEWVSLNPQPLPPGSGGGFAGGSIVSPGGWVSLNPQPLPPGSGGGLGSGPIVSPGEWVSLNPQPLPPGGGSGFGLRNPGPIGTWGLKDPGPIGFLIGGSL